MVATASAHAADPYGEAHRFGGFDAAYFNSGGYDGSSAPAPGRFLNPTGFAVDASDPDGTAIYVVDRTSRTPSQLGSARSQWRLQKLSESGAVEGVASFSLPGGQPLSDYPSIAAITVDSGSAGNPGRVYVSLQDVDTHAAIAIVAWSTRVVDGKLTTPDGLTADTYTQAEDGSQSAGVLSTSAQLNLDSTTVFPTALAIAGTGTGRTLAVMSGDIGVPAAITRIALTNGGGRAAGDKLETWTPAELTGLPNAPDDIGAYQRDYGGLSRDPDGGLTATLSAVENARGAGAVAVVRLGPDLDQPRVLESWVNTPAMFPPFFGLDFSRWAAVSTPTFGAIPKPSSQVVALSNGRYAAMFLEVGQATPWTARSAGSGFWYESNLGIRLLAPVSAPGESWDGSLSNPDVPVSSILNTLGNVSGRGDCALSFNNINNTAGLATGSDGSVWALTAGDDAGQAQTDGVAVNGREVIELSPGASERPCSQPQGTFAAATGGRDLDASAPITIPVASTVDFDASALLVGTWGYKYEWDLDGDASNGYEQATRWLAPDDFETRQDPTARHQYTRPGVYTIRLRMHGDFGVVEREARVVVQSTTAPAASFTASTNSAFVGDEVAFDASASSASPDTRLLNYHWDYGDGVIEDSSTPQIDHVFGAAGSYSVRLTVRGSDQQVSTAATRTVTVSARDIVQPPPPDDRRTPIVVPPPQQRPPVIPAPVADTTAPDISLKLRAARDALVATLGCPVGESACVGTIKLTATTRVKVGKGRRARLRTSVVTVGQVSFSLAGGQSRTVTAKLNGAGRGLLKRGALRVQVIVTTRDQAGNASSKRRTVTIRRAAARRAARKKARR
ncbi:PKD domain-containing protein [Conexibacter sp. CPCC 206217]|uniref:PKD domain-containing protein n=1 Tax=Conexibacter sp. CPCC 206217 TaxID=3064574 RepID=UPI00272A693F|nr:PKD domain-containing protein [Conexibacter sp. CPCC 206217]